jgi:large subunit ribosomal protein L10
MDRLEKKEAVSMINKKLQASYTVVVVHYHGLTVAEITNLRRNMRANDAEFMVIKNSLARLAFANTKFENLASLLNGPAAIAFSADPVAPAKAIVKFAANNDKLVLLGGMVNMQMLDSAGVKLLATMPSLDELRAKIIGMISTPATRIASVLSAPAASVARVIGAFANKDQ